MDAADAFATKKGYLRNKILAGEQDIDMLTETVQRPAKFQYQNQNQNQMQYPPQIQNQIQNQNQYQQYPPQFQNPNQFQYQNQYQQYPPQARTDSAFNDANQLMSLARALLMSLQSTASRRKLFHKFRGSGAGAGAEDFDDDAGAELPDVDVSFEYLKHTRDNGPYGGVQSRRALDSAPIIPTLDSLDSKPSNNQEYRRQMNVQRKLALATGARANSLQGGDARAMSLNSASSGYGPRAMSLNGPNGFMNRQMQQQQMQHQPFPPQQYPQQQYPPQNPRAMSMRSYGGNPMPPNGQDPRTMSLNSQGNGFGVAGPRTMSLQGNGMPPPQQANYRVPNGFQNNGNPGFNPQMGPVPNAQNAPRAMSLNSNTRFNGRVPPPTGNGQFPPYNGQYPQYQMMPPVPPNMATYKTQKPSDELLMNVVEEEEEQQVQQENLSTDSFNPSVISEDSGRLRYNSRLQSTSPAKQTTLDSSKLKTSDNSDDDDVVYKFDEEPPSISRKSTLKKSNSMKLRKLTLFQQEAETTAETENENENENENERELVNQETGSPTFNIRKSTSTFGESPTKRVSVLTDNESSKGALENKFNALGATATMNSTASSNNVYYTATSILPIRSQVLGMSIEDTIEEEEKTPKLAQYNDDIDTPKLAQKADDTATLHDLDDDGDRTTLHDTSLGENVPKEHMASFEEDLNEEVPFSPSKNAKDSVTGLQQPVTPLKLGSVVNTPDLNDNSTELTRFSSNDSSRSGRRKPSFKAIVGNTVFSNFRSPSLNSNSPTFAKEEPNSNTSKDLHSANVPPSSKVLETPTKSAPVSKQDPTPAKTLPSPNIDNLTSTTVSHLIDDEILDSPTRKPYGIATGAPQIPEVESDDDMNSRIFNPTRETNTAGGSSMSALHKDVRSDSSGSNYSEEEEEEGTATDDNGLNSVPATSGTSTTTTNTVLVPNMASMHSYNPQSSVEATTGSDSTLNPKLRRKPPMGFSNSPTRIHATRPLSDVVASPVTAEPLGAREMTSDREEPHFVPIEVPQRKLSIQSSEDGNKKRDSLGFAGKSKNFLRRWSKASRRLSEDFSLNSSGSIKNDDRNAQHRQSMPLIRNSVHSMTTLSNSGSRNVSIQSTAMQPTPNPTPIKFTKEELGIMNSTNELLNELQLVTTELASSIRRELSLEKQLKGTQMGEPVRTNVIQPSLEDYTNRMKTIADLQEKLNKERRLRFISEDHALLWENGQQPSALKLGYEKAEIYQQLLSKNDLVNQLQDKVSELESKKGNNPDLLTKYNDLLLENTQLKLNMKQQESSLIQTRQQLYEALNSKENYMHTKNLSLINSFAASEADEVAEKIESYKEEVFVLKKQREELREAIGKLSHANDYELKLANDKIKVLEEKVDHLKGMNTKLSSRLDSRNSMDEEHSGANIPGNFGIDPNTSFGSKGGKLQGFSIVSPSQNLIRDRVN